MYSTSTTIVLRDQGSYSGCYWDLNPRSANPGKAKRRNYVCTWFFCVCLWGSIAPKYKLFMWWNYIRSWMSSFLTAQNSKRSFVSPQVKLSRFREMSWNCAIEPNSLRFKLWKLCFFLMMRTHTPTCTSSVLLLIPHSHVHLLTHVLLHTCSYTYMYVRICKFTTRDEKHHRCK